MKTTIKFLTLFLILLIFSCKKEEATPVDTCKLSKIDRGNGNVHNYTYDANGRIATMAREFDGSGSGKISKFVYTFTYDITGLLTKSTWTLDGSPDGSETYTYTNGKVSKALFTYTDGSKGFNNIKYDANGNITEFTFEFGDPNTDGKQYFEYDANNIMTKRGYADLQNNKFFEAVIKPVGSVKSSESLLNNSLPYDVLTGFSWAKANGKEGTTIETFEADNNLKLVSTGEKITVKSIKINSKGYLIETISTDNTNKSNTESFTLIDCI